MSESGSNASGYRLKKSDDGSIFGPVDRATLIEWADSAQIAPTDEIASSEDDWKPAPEIDFLNMHYQVTFDDGQRYGPTTVGTLREFLKEDIIKEDTKVTNTIKKSKSPLVALLQREEYAGSLEEAQARLSKEEDGLPGLELAKDQRIRQLEEDLRTARKDYNELMEKYRQVNREFSELKSRVS